MKKTIITLFTVLVAAVGSKAQQIAVVSTDGTTTVHSMLQEAIENAKDGSVVYLPGGGFPIDDSVKVTRRLTIIGIGHKVNGDNADGYTTISGNLFFNEGSSGSAVIGLYMTGGVKIGSDDSKVDNVLVRYCNMDHVWVCNNKCLGTVVNQNYLRSSSAFSGASVQFTNNIAHSVADNENGVIANNIFNGWYTKSINYWTHAYVFFANNTSIINNIILNQPNNYSYQGMIYGSNCLTSGNMAQSSFGDNYINVSGTDWADIFVNNAGITPQSDYHFKGEYEKYNSQCGIYAGTGFSDAALPPVPYIVSKQIPEQTDAEGKLNIKIRVRAGE